MTSISDSFNSFMPKDEEKKQVELINCKYCRKTFELPGKNKKKHEKLPLCSTCRKNTKKAAQKQQSE